MIDLLTYLHNILFNISVLQLTLRPKDSGQSTPAEFCLCFIKDSVSIFHHHDAIYVVESGLFGNNTLPSVNMFLLRIILHIVLDLHS